MKNDDLIKRYTKLQKKISDFQNSRNYIAKCYVKNCDIVSELGSGENISIPYDDDNMRKMNHRINKQNSMLLNSKNKVESLPKSAHKKFIKEMIVGLACSVISAGITVYLNPFGVLSFANFLPSSLILIATGYNASQNHKDYLYLKRQVKFLALNPIFDSNVEIKEDVKNFRKNKNYKRDLTYQDMLTISENKKVFQLNKKIV